MKNILYVHSSLFLSGGERVTENIFKGLVENPTYSAYLLCNSKNTDFIQLANSYKVKFYGVNFIELSVANFFNILSATYSLAKLFKVNKIDIIHVVDPVAYRYIAIAAQICNIPILFHHHFRHTESGLKWFFKRLKKPDVHVFCCKSIERTGRNALQQFENKSRFKVIYNSIDTDKFYFNPQSINDVCNIVVIGNFQESKGHNDFIEIAECLIKRGYSCKFHLLGQEIPGTGREVDLKNKIKKAGLSHCFTFHGFIDNPEKILDSMHILVCASKQEALPMSILEAMAKGVSVVSTDVDGIPEAINNEKEGFLHSAGEIEQPVKNIEILINNDTLRAKQLLAAREKVERYFSQDVFIEGFIEEYEKI